MTTVNGYTAEKMDAILNQTIKSATVTAGNLILTKYNETTVNAGSVIGPQGATGNPFICTSTTRPGTPVKGQMIYETDTGKLLVWYGATTQWQEPWDLPWGYIARASYTSDALWNGYSGSTWQDALTTSAGGGTAILSLNPVTLYLNRLYEVNVSLPLYSYLATPTTKFRIATGSGTVLATFPKVTLQSGIYLNYSPTVTFTVSSAVSAATVKLQYLHDATPASSLAANGSYAEISIKDAGPTSTPPSA